MSKDTGSDVGADRSDDSRAAPTAHRVGGASSAQRAGRTGGHRLPGPDRPVAYIEQCLCDRSPTCPVRAICPKDAVVAAPGSPTAKTHRKWFGQRRPPEEPSSWRIDEDRCTGCLLCAQYCPHRAVVPGTRRQTG
ncbi:MAG: 4Fe-4S binding protein [Actinobacteria bacterium]|nr:4Fe-4S binding protein [Actinomycetota bacterium]